MKDKINRGRLIRFSLISACVLIGLKPVSTFAGPSAASIKEAEALQSEMKDIEELSGDPIFEGQHPDKRELRKIGGAGAIAILTPQFQKMTEFAAKSPQAEVLARIDLLYYTARLAYWGQTDRIDAIKKMSSSDDLTLATRGKIGWNLMTWIDAAQDSNRAEQATALADMQAIAASQPKNTDVARAMVYLVDHLKLTVNAAHGLNLAVAGMKVPFAVAYTKSAARIGEPVVFEGKALKGPDFSTAKWKGKVVMVDFWATWCPPCRASIPEVIERYKKYHEQGFEVLGVSSDVNRLDLVNFLKDQPDMVWPQLWVQNYNQLHPLGMKFHIQGVPTVYLIDRDGILRETECGRPLNEDMITKVLAESAAVDKPAKS